MMMNKKIIYKFPDMEIFDKLLIDKIDTTNLKKCLVFNKKNKINFIEIWDWLKNCYTYQEIRKTPSKKNDIYCSECYDVIYNYVLNIFEYYDMLDELWFSQQFNLLWAISMAVSYKKIKKGQNMIDDYFQKRKELCWHCNGNSQLSYRRA